MHTLRTTRLGLITIALSTFGCSSPQQSTATAKAPAPLFAPPQQLWGTMTPVVSVKELMRDLIDPASDYVFDAIGTVITNKGRVEKMPTTDEDWDRIRVGGVMMAEGAYLLKIPRPFAPPGDENNSTGPEPEELSPAQIKAKLEDLYGIRADRTRKLGMDPK